MIPFPIFSVTDRQSRVVFQALQFWRVLFFFLFHFSYDVGSFRRQAPAIYQFMDTRWRNKLAEGKGIRKPVSGLDWKLVYYIDTDEIPGFSLLLKNHIFTARGEDTIIIFHMWGYWCRHGCHGILTYCNRKYKYYCLYFSFIILYPSFMTFLWRAFCDFLTTLIALFCCSEND